MSKIKSTGWSETVFFGNLIKSVYVAVVSQNKLKLGNL